MVDEHVSIQSNEWWNRVSAWLLARILVAVMRQRGDGGGDAAEPSCISCPLRLGTPRPPSPRFIIAMIRGPFTNGALGSFLDAFSFRPSAESASGEGKVAIPAAESHFGPCVTVETRGITIGREMSGQNVGHVKYLKTFFQRQMATHSLLRSTASIKCCATMHPFN